MDAKSWANAYLDTLEITKQDVPNMGIFVSTYCTTNNKSVEEAEDMYKLVRVIENERYNGVEDFGEGRW